VDCLGVEENKQWVQAHGMLAGIAFMFSFSQWQAFCTCYTV